MILRALWLRPTLRHPVRAVVTVLGVAIGVASVVSTLLASRAAVASMGDDVERLAGRARLEITGPAGVELRHLEALRPICAEALLAPVIEGTALSPDLGDLVRVLGVDLLLDSEVRAVELASGEVDGSAGLDSMLLGNGVALSRSLAQRLEVELGDEFGLVVHSRPVELTVAAILEPRELSGVWDRVVLTDIALAQELFGRLDRVDRVELVPRGEVDVAALTARTRALLPDTYRVGPASVRREEGERMVRALEFNLTALAGVSLLVGVVLVATTLATSIVQRRAQIALLRSLGASRAMLARAVLIESGSIGLLGGLIGVGLGWAGASQAVTSVGATVATIAGEAIPGAVRLGPGGVLLGLGLGLVVSMLAAVLPLREAWRTPPVQGLRTEHAESVARRPWRTRAISFCLLVVVGVVCATRPAVDDRPVWALVSALALLSTLLVLAGPLIDLFAGLRLRGLPIRARVTLRLAQASLESGRRRAAWAAGAVGVAVGLAVSMTTMVGSFRTSVVEWTSQAMPSDLFVRPLATDSGALAGRLDPEVARITREVLGAENVDAFHQSKAYFRELPVLLAGAEFDVVAREGGVPFLDGRPATEVFRDALASGRVIVNEPFARRFDVWRGDRIQVETPGGPIEREVAGVYRDYSGHTGRVVLDLADYFTAYPDEGPQSISAFVGADADIEAARTRLVAALGGAYAVEILNNREVRAGVLEVFERTFAVTVALQLISSVVAAIAVIAVLTALIHERRRELAVVRVLGGSWRQQVAVVLYEALLLGLAGTLGGLLVGLAVGYVLVAVVNLQSFGWSLGFAPPASLFLTLLAVVPACLIAGLVPALLSLRTTPGEALRATA